MEHRINNVGKLLGVIMTRYARGVQGTHRKPAEATPWAELKPITEKPSKERKVSKKSKPIKKHETNGESSGADYRRSKKKKKKPQWKKTEWEMLETGAEETKGLAADLIQQDEDDKNPTKYRPKKAEKKEKGKSLRERLEEAQSTYGEFNEEQKKELTDILKKDDRRENRRVKREDERMNAKTCFNCREPGHDMAACPHLRRDVDHGTGICFKCGSTEHGIADCRVRLPPGEFPYAKCFICGEQGHLSKQCPDNPRGLYPNGGCCRGCGSVEHYKKDCPELLKEQGLEGVTVSRMSINVSVDEEESLQERTTSAPKKHKPKVVKF